jgi:hypothetical protein
MSRVKVRKHRRFAIWRSGLPDEEKFRLYKKALEREFARDKVDWRAVKYLQRGLRMCEARLKEKRRA